MLNLGLHRAKTMRRGCLLILLFTLSVGCDSSSSGDGRKVTCNQSQLAQEVARYETNTQTCAQDAVTADSLTGLAKCMDQGYSQSLGRCLSSDADDAFGDYHKARERAARNVLSGRITREEFDEIAAKTPLDYI